MAAPVAKSLKELLLTHTAVAAEALTKVEPDGALRCLACGHRCRIYEGRDGICKVRSRRDGKLLVPWGYVAGVQSDPIEKKPFFHVMPGTTALSFGMLGCDFHCSYCQNWVTSQSLRDPNAAALPTHMTPQELLDLARETGAKTLTSTYNEPLITSEWAVEIFRAAKAQGFRTSYVSNGNATPEVLEFIRPYVDYYKIDLKGFNDKHYRELGGVLENIKQSIRRVYEMGFWLEIVTLIIPGFNDSDDELKALTEFLVSVSPDIPWHATAFYQNYKMLDTANTPAKTLLRAAEIGKRAGLNFIYLGNVPGQVGEYENTYCSHCRELLVERRGYRILKQNISGGSCPKCRKKVPGVWE